MSYITIQTGSFQSRVFSIIKSSISSCFILSSIFFFMQHQGVYALDSKDHLDTKRLNELRYIVNDLKQDPASAASISFLNEEIKDQIRLLSLILDFYTKEATNQKPIKKIRNIISTLEKEPYKDFSRIEFWKSIEEKYQNYLISEFDALIVLPITIDTQKKARSIYSIIAKLSEFGYSNILDFIEKECGDALFNAEQLKDYSEWKREYQKNPSSISFPNKYSAAILNQKLFLSPSKKTIKKLTQVSNIISLILEAVDSDTDISSLTSFYSSIQDTSNEPCSESISSNSNKSEKIATIKESIDQIEDLICALYSVYDYLAYRRIESPLVKKYLSKNNSSSLISRTSTKIREVIKTINELNETSLSKKDSDFLDSIKSLVTMIDIALNDLKNTTVSIDKSSKKSEEEILFEESSFKSKISKDIFSMIRDLKTTLNQYSFKTIETDSESIKVESNQTQTPNPKEIVTTTTTTTTTTTSSSSSSSSRYSTLQECMNWYIRK